MLGEGIIEEVGTTIQEEYMHDDEKLRLLKVNEVKKIDKVKDVDGLEKLPDLHLDPLPTIGKGTWELLKIYEEVCFHVDSPKFPGGVTNSYS